MTSNLNPESNIIVQRVTPEVSWKGFENQLLQQYNLNPEGSQIESTSASNPIAQPSGEQ
jgi:hypothetical protein